MLNRTASLGFACVLIAVGAAPAAFAVDSRVRIDNFTFNPPALTVRAGTKVTFDNDDDIPHTVVATDNSFRSPALDTADSFSVTLTKPGEVHYFCSLHPHMTGTIIVVP